MWNGSTHSNISGHLVSLTETVADRKAKFVLQPDALLGHNANAPHRHVVHRHQPDDSVSINGPHPACRKTADSSSTKVALNSGGRNDLRVHL